MVCQGNSWGFRTYEKYVPRYACIVQRLQVVVYKYAKRKKEVEKDLVLFMYVTDGVFLLIVGSTSLSDSQGNGT